MITLQGLKDKAMDLRAQVEAHSEYALRLPLVNASDEGILQVGFIAHTRRAVGEETKSIATAFWVDVPTLLDSQDRAQSARLLIGQIDEEVARLLGTAA